MKPHIKLSTRKLWMVPQTWSCDGVLGVSPAHAYKQWQLGLHRARRLTSVPVEFVTTETRL